MDTSLSPSPLNPQINFIKVHSPLSWDEYFMFQAMMASFKSKDPSTKVGCLFVNEDNHQVGMGYNGLIAGIDETQLPWGKDPRVGLEFQKYGYVVHAEANAILHASESLEGARCYVTLFPCNECAKLIASKKVKEIIYLSDKHENREYSKIAKKIFRLANINYRQQVISKELIEKFHDYLNSLVEM